MNSTCGTKMSGNENMRVFFANVYSLQMIEFSYSSFVKNSTRAEMKGLCMGGIKLKKQSNNLKQKRLQCPQSTADQQSLMSVGL